MPTKFSPTTLIGWLKSVCVVPLLVYVFWRLFTDPSFDALKTGLEMVAVAGVINQILSTVNGHYVADADAVDPALKTNATGPTGRVVAILFLVLGLGMGGAACAYLPPAKGQTATAAQHTVANDLQTVAIAIRHAEGAGFSPAEFDAFLENYVALVPGAQPYIKDAELAYALLEVGGSVSAAGIESLAARYDE